MISISELSARTKLDPETLNPWDPGLDAVPEYRINREQRKDNRLVHQEAVVVLAPEGNLNIHKNISTIFRLNDNV